MVLHHGLNFQLAVQYVHLKGVTYDAKYFDDFCHLQKCAIYIFFFFGGGGLSLPIKMDRIFW
jgi:hypothetical protein